MCYCSPQEDGVRYDTGAGATEVEKRQRYNLILELLVHVLLLVA